MNIKHRAILLLTYSSGLRVSEVVRLQLCDLDLDRKTIHIRLGKGKKDRFTLLSDTAMNVVYQYLKEYKPAKWLFPGSYPKAHLTERTVQKTFEQAVTRSGIQKKVSVHTLRHCFATHPRTTWTRKH